MFYIEQSSSDRTLSQHKDHSKMNETLGNLEANKLLGVVSDLSIAVTLVRIREALVA